MSNDSDGSNWQAVTGRALAFLCLQNSDFKNKKLGEQAKFLKGLGLSTADAAGVLNTTSASLYELDRQARKKKGATRGSKKGKSRKG